MKGGGDGAAPSSEAALLIQAERRALHRVLSYVKKQAKEVLGGSVQGRSGRDLDQQLVELRDQIAEARLEDVPPLVERMSQLSHLSRQLPTSSSGGRIDASSPYFGRMVLREDGRERELLIGSSTYLDTQAGIRIVDWRDAPVSRLYYRYEEGEDYLETFGEQEREGEVVVRRSVSVSNGGLQRIQSRDRTLVNTSDGWTEVELNASLSGGEGSSTKAEAHLGRLPGPRGRQRKNKEAQLGGGESLEQDRRLKQITALIDRRQFDLITRPDSGLVVIQGGAGSGKTTIALHRIAYLHYHKPKRFAASRMLIVVYNAALARYIAAAVSTLGLSGIGVRTFGDWALRLRRWALPRIKLKSNAEASPVVTRLKRHPAMVKAVEIHVERLRNAINLELSLSAPANSEIQRQVHAQWQKRNHRPLAHQLHAFRKWLDSATVPLSVRHGLERAVSRGQGQAQDLLTAWAEVLTNREELQAALFASAGRVLSEEELEEAIAQCAESAEAVLDHVEEAEEEGGRRKRRNNREAFAADGQALEEALALTPEDDAVLLRLSQLMRGPLLRESSKEALVYEHLLVDEAQDLSPLELKVLLSTVSGAQSITLAGDVAQRQHMDNGFTSWAEVLEQLSLRHVEVEPLRLSYRSTHPIVNFAHELLGPLAPPERPQAVRPGPPVELFQFDSQGEEAAFLTASLRALLGREPRASVVVITRRAAQASSLFQALRRAELPGLRLVLDQDFPFKPGVDVTEVRQVKGLEFDYVLLMDVTDHHYPADEEGRHLLHIAATRAAHQLWLFCTGRPSELLAGMPSSTWSATSPQ